MKKILNKFNFKKTIAVFTASTFIFTCIFGNSAFASMGSSMPAINTVNFDIPIIPTSLGKITSAKYFDSEDIIINIQDLHCHAETQRKIASIIGYIDNTYNLNNVYLEGAFNTVDTSWLSSFNNNQNGTKILEGLIDSGKLSGTEYYSIINNKKNFVLGIEDEALYKENIKLLGSILSLQPEVNAICSQLEKEINKIKRDYSSRQARKLEKLIKAFRNKEIDAKYYYSQLIALADGCNLSLNKYPNIKIYISLLEKAQYLNNKKVVYEFSKFVTEMKNVLPYQQYCDLLKKSNNFGSLDDISIELIELDKKYSITNKLGLTNFKNFLTYLEFNQNINPVKLIQEEESFINELYVKLGRTKYEKEVAFMFDFIPTIEKYFSADISADEYYKFEKNYNLFKTIWPSYFSLNVLKNLEQYQKLLSKYHKNNITRDQIFADSLITQKNLNNSVRVSDTNLAIRTIKSNLNNKKIKLVVTGGFHTRGLEKIFEQQKISYVIITPKITQPIEQAKQIYIDNVMYYSNILKNTINLEPLTQEPLNVSFPKIMNLIFSEVQKNSIFEEYSKQNTKQAIKQFIQDYIISKQSDFYGQVEILNWDIISDDLTGNIEFVVSYKDNANKQMVSTIRYKFVDGNIIPYSSVDIEKTKNMLERVTSNKYAQPSIELEPTNAVRKKIAKHILEPLQKVAGSSISLMPAEQLHMTIGYDATPMTQEQIDSLVEESDISADIFSVLDILDQDFVNSKTAMTGTLKLMPDGVIIYEITDKNLLKQMFGLRTSLLNVDSKYKTPSIVHMSIGRITDKKLLDDSEQSKQELAELLEKINETIYEINKKNALSKIKTTFTLKSGYVSSTGDKDYVYRRVLPKRESLVIFSNLMDSSKTRMNFINKVIIVPIVEEVLFRFVPFVVTGLFISNPTFVVPAIVTGIVSMLGFSMAHPLADRINNYFYEKIEQGKITNKFIAKLFTGKVPVRKMSSFLFQSASLTYIFLAVSFVFPQLTLLALAVSVFYHSLNNFFVLRQEDKLPLLSIKQDSSKEKNLNFGIDEMIKELDLFVKKNDLYFVDEFYIQDFGNDFSKNKENKEEVIKTLLELFNFVVDKNKSSKKSSDFNSLLVPILKFSVSLKDEQGKILFDRIFKDICVQATESNSTQYFDILIESAKYFYKTGQISYVNKIMDSLYKNKSLVVSEQDYGKFALPVPSPFSSSFGSAKKWEEEVYKIMMEDSVLDGSCYLPVLDILLAPSVVNPDKYAKSYMRALYKSGKQINAPSIKGVNEYELAKTFYKVCGISNEIFMKKQSAPLLNENTSEFFPDDIEIVKTKNLYLSDVLSRLKFVKQLNSSNKILNSEQYLQIIEKLTAALSLSKQAQIKVITEQMNELTNIFISNDCFKDTTILETLIPILAFVKDNETSQSLLKVVSLKCYEDKIFDEETFFNIALFLYDINKQEFFALIGEKYDERERKNMFFGDNWKYWRPESLQEAYDRVPVELKDRINNYEDLELFYHALGIEFDSMEEPSSLYERRDYVPEYQLLLDKLPSSVFEQSPQTRKYFRNLKKKMLSTQPTAQEDKMLPVYFEALEKVLDNNALALSEINNANEDSIKESFFFVEEMINNFAVLNERLAEKARISLNKIKESFFNAETTVADIIKLKAWSAENMDKIKEVHTLINAVHQTAINSLMKKSNSSSLEKRCIFKDGYKECFSFFDCSSNKISNQMEDFIAFLSSLNLGKYLMYGSNVRVVTKDDKMLYSNSLEGAHSVDLMVDFNEGIRVTFNDSNRGDGNLMRVILLASIFAQTGFDITDIDAKTNGDGFCKVSAMFSLPKNALNNGIEYAKYFAQALVIVENVNDLDFILEARDPEALQHSYGEYIIPPYDIDKFKKLKNSTSLPEGFSYLTLPAEIKNNEAERKKRLSPLLEQKWSEITQSLGYLRERIEQRERLLDSVYEYLSIEKESKKNVWEIVSEYVKGKLVINENGELERNSKYDVIDNLLDAIETNIDDTLRQSQVINTLNYDSFNFETEGYIGGMVALSGLLRLDGKGWLSVKAAVDKERKRSKFAYVEFVDFNGDRTRLNYKELIKILKDFGYVVKDQKVRSSSEKEDAKTVLEEKILFPKDGIYTRGMSVSGQADKYIPVRITYDKNNVDENSMWVVSYTSPEDVATIIKSGAIMTTSGGMLSHANITARENNKTAILSNGKWVDGKLVIPYFSIRSPIMEKRRGYQVQKISEQNLVLEEGAAVLANGINGRVLVYNAIPKETIDDIQKAIDDNNLDFIKKYMQDHVRDKNIKQVVEYIFLQVNTNEKKQEITKYLLDFDKRSEIGIKISELNRVYIGEKLKAINKYIKNEAKIKDANIRLAVIRFIEQELVVLKYSLKADDEAIKEMQDLLSTLTEDKQSALSQRGDEVRKIIKEVNEILSKKNVSEQEKDELVKISERAKVWNYYENYEMKRLVARIDKIISLEEGKNYETEIRDFENIEAKDVLRYGTKTTELAKLFKLLKNLGTTIATVPYGMGISKDVLRIFFERNGLADKYLQLMKEFQQAVKSKNKEKAIEIGKQISELIESLDDEQLESYIKLKLENNKKYAVRSSGVGEDGANHAFAGMAKTELNVNKDNVYSYVKEGWKSFFTATCVEDMVKAGIVVQPALLIQEMVSGVEKAGVIFTRDNSGNLTIEGVYGLGEGLVSGRITPDHVTVRASDDGMEYRRALNNMTKIEEKEEGGTKVTKLTEEEKIERILDENTIKQLKEVANLLEEDAGYPVDIEFAIDKNGKIFVLQRRAITTLVKQGQQEPVSDFDIEQPLIDKTIERLSKLAGYYGQVSEIIKTLSNLPKDKDKKNNVVINQIFELIKFLKKNGSNYFYGINNERGNVNEELIPIIMPFLEQDKDLFHVVIQSLFYQDEDKTNKREKYKTLSDIGFFMREAYLVKPELMDYIIKISVSEEFLDLEEEMPRSIEQGLDSLGYDAQKQYYFVMASYYETDNNLAKILFEYINKIKKDILPKITDTKVKEDINEILRSMEELSGKINVGSIPLLEILIRNLFDEALILKNTDKNSSFQIIELLFSVCEQILSKTEKLNSEVLDIKEVKKFLIEEYDNGSDNNSFNSMISQLISLVQQKQDNDYDSIGKKITDMLIEIALHIYKPISSKQIKDADSKQYQKIKDLTLDIFGKLASKRSEDTSIYNALFNNSIKDRNIEEIGVGFNPETLKIFIDAIKTDNHIFPIILPDDAFISGDIDLLTDMIVDSVNKINLIFELQRVFNEDEDDFDDFYDDDFKVEEKKDKAKKLLIGVIEKMVSLANDETVNLEKRKRIVSILMKMISEGFYKEIYKEIPIEFEKIKSLAEKLDIPEFLHMGDYSQYYKGHNTVYNFTPLIKSIPENILKANPLAARYSNNRISLEDENPVLTQIIGKTDMSKSAVKEAISRFEVLQKILESNRMVLLSLDNIKNSKNYEKDIKEILNELKKMIDELKKINVEHGTATEKALKRIRKSLTDSNFNIKEQEKKHLLISKWNTEGLEDIDGLHTLINAVHQTAIVDFKAEIGNVKEEESLQTITASQKSTIRGYNLSATANPNIVKFISKLATRSLPNRKNERNEMEIDDFICKDDLILWSTILNVHSVDIFFNFGDVDRGISLYYRESLSAARDIGKEERLRYFREILRYLGFFVEEPSEDIADPYSLKATLNKNFGMNDDMDLIDIASHVVEIFKFSTNLDYDFKTKKRRSGYEEVFKNWLEKAKRRELWFGFQPNNDRDIYGYGSEAKDLDSLPNKKLLNVESLNAILEYLGCDLLPEGTSERMLTNSIYLNEHFNKPIERAYAEGRIIFDENGVLVRKENYDITRLIIDEINNNFEETTKQSRTVNLVNSYEFDTKILAKIGNFVIVSSVMELKNGDKLFVKAVMDPNTKRMKYAITERVNTETRKTLTNDELTDLLIKEGYYIPKQTGISKTEEKRIKNSLLRQVQTLESRKISATSTSDGMGISIVGNITFDKNKIDENSILLAPYTTPDDIESIEKAKGIITTGGGVLSHAAITTREMKKPSVVLNGSTWTSDANNELEVLYYLPSGDVQTIDDKYHVQNVKTTRKILKEGSRVLMNGETGIVLLFDDIDVDLLNELQKYIDEDDSTAVIKFMNKYSKNDNINRFVEYVYFQVVGNPRTQNVLNCLFFDTMPETVKDKVNKLNDGYIQDKVQSISEAIENLKVVRENNIKIAYNILQELNKKLEFIKTVGTRQDIENLKMQIEQLEQEIKEELNKYLQTFISDLNKFLLKETLNMQDIQEITGMLKNVEVYNYFVAEDETSEDLLADKEKVRDLFELLKEKIASYDTEEQQELTLQNEISLFEDNAENDKLFGSKTAELAKIFKNLKQYMNFIVPDGIGISVNVLPMLLKSVGQESLLFDFYDAIENKNKEKAMAVSEKISKFLDSDMQKNTNMEKEIMKQLNRFIKSGQKYSVRSSGVGEDGANNAFAGMGETELNVEYNDIYQNILKCWKAFFSEKCIDYMITSGQIVKPAVLVQDMIDSEVSGVVFSREKYGNGRINAVFGLGEGIVSGKLTPDSIAFDMNTGEVIEYLVANKQFKFVADAVEKTKKVPVGQVAKTRTLNYEMVTRLANIVKELEKTAGYPIDVEFAIKDNQIYVLQMRPITTLGNNKEQISEMPGAGSVVGNDEIQNSEVVEARYGISLMAGNIKDKRKEFVNIANPLDNTKSISVYVKSVDSKVTEFIVDSEYTDMVRSGLLGKLLLDRINSDPVILAKLNDGVFNYKAGEIELLPILDENIIEKSLSEDVFDIGVDNVKSILASA